MTRPLLLASALALVAACALTSKAPPYEVRYFSPESPPAEAPAAMPIRAAAPVPVRLGRVVASEDLRAPIIHRESAVERDRYDQLRWSELPEAFVRRALAGALFERGRPLAQAVGGAVAVVDVDVLAFEEVRRGDRRTGRVQLAFRLRDEHVVRLRGVVTIEREPSSTRIDAVVTAIAAAMDAAVAEVADRVAAELCAAPAPAAACTTCDPPRRSR